MSKFLENCAIALLIFGKIRCACIAARLVRDPDCDTILMLQGGWDHPSLRDEALRMLLSEVSDGRETTIYD